MLGAVAGLCVAAALGLLVAVRPGWALGLAAGILALTFVLAVVLENRAALAFVPVLALTGVATAVLWPTLTVGIAAFVVLVLLLRRSPGYAFLLALLLIGLEGSIKLRLMLEGAPAPRALGAGLLDLAFGAAVLGLMAHDRGRTMRLAWERASRLERVAFSLVVAWLVVSVFQIPQGGSLVNGIEGFRLMQAYFLAVFAGMVLFRVAASTERLTDLFLVVLLALSGYAALRTATGPSGEETSFALLRTNQASFGDAGRGIGSFSSVVGLASFLAPAGVFGLVLGFLQASQGAGLAHGGARGRRRGELLRPHRAGGDGGGHRDAGRHPDRWPQCPASHAGDRDRHDLRGSGRVLRGCAVHERRLRPDGATGGRPSRSVARRVARGAVRHLGEVARHDCR